MFFNITLKFLLQEREQYMFYEMIGDYVFGAKFHFYPLVLMFMA
jgi:hypothetical protein